MLSSEYRTGVILLNMEVYTRADGSPDCLYNQDGLSGIMDSIPHADRLLA